MNLPGSDRLDIQYLNRLFDNTSECYKFFWFHAILTEIRAGHSSCTFETLIDSMIAEAWYMVSEYHLNLGPADNLERVCNRIHEISNLLPADDRSKILAYIRDCDDSEVSGCKRTLIQNVPYRLQAPFLPDFRGKDWNVGTRKLAEEINRRERLIYYFSEISGLSTRINISDEWMEYLTVNGDIIEGWLRYNMIQYLQRRNPSVPGIADKVEPPKERKLDEVKKFWRLETAIEPVRDIYGDVELGARDISIDHFVPWSYVAHDEFWNLLPTTRSINSSKSNNLPEWNEYWSRMSGQAYRSYTLMWENDMLHEAFNKCADHHLNDINIRHRLYREGQSQDEFCGELKTVMLPVYQSAKNVGFREWRYSGA